MAPDVQASPAPKVRCPSCGSRDVVTTSKVVDDSTYWRCAGCGEIWNVARQLAAARRPRPYGR